jgi:hypothetical protein
LNSTRSSGSVSFCIVVSRFINSPDYVNEFGLHIRSLNNQSSNSNRQLESPGTCAAGIQKQNSVAMRNRRLMRVTANHNREVPRRWSALHLFQVVQHID